MRTSASVRGVVNLTLNLTHACNLRCSYCFTHGRSAEKMPLELGKRSIDLAFSNAREFSGKTVELCFWGGEPLLEWKLLMGLIRYAEKRKPYGVHPRFVGTTNGTLVTEDKMDFAKDHGFYLLVSLDGTQETHDRHRKTAGGGGSHAAVMRSVESMLKRFPGQKVRISPYPERIGHFYEDVKYLVDHGIYNIMYSPVYEHDWTDEDWLSWQSECWKVIDLICEYKEKGVLIEIEHFRRFAERWTSFYPCGAGRHYIHVDCDGSLWPCHRFNKMDDHRSWRQKPACLGHIDHGITRPDVHRLFTGLRRTCSWCGYFPKCSGGCYAINYDLMGDIFRAPSKLCKYTAMQSSVSRRFQEKVYPKGMPEAVQEHPIEMPFDPCGWPDPGGRPPLPFIGTMNLLARKIAQLEKACEDPETLYA